MLLIEDLKSILLRDSFSKDLKLRNKETKAKQFSWVKWHLSNINSSILIRLFLLLVNKGIIILSSKLIKVICFSFGEKINSKEYFWALFILKESLLFKINDFKFI